MFQGEFYSCHLIQIKSANARLKQMIYRFYKQHLYGTTRAMELAAVSFRDEEKAAFIAQPFQAQHHHYMTYYDDAAFEVLLLDEQPIGRLYVHRSTSEIRIMDIALLPAYYNQGLGSFLNS
jgi:hypothetical protein